MGGESGPGDGPRGFRGERWGGGTVVRRCGGEVQKEEACLKEGESKVGEVVSITGQVQAHGGCLGDGGDLSLLRIRIQGVFGCLLCRWNIPAHLKFYICSYSTQKP